MDARSTLKGLNAELQIFAGRHARMSSNRADWAMAVEFKTQRFVGKTAYREIRRQFSGAFFLRALIKGIISGSHPWNKQKIAPSLDSTLSSSYGNTEAKLNSSIGN
jgi:hypothetical protein